MKGYIIIRKIPETCSDCRFVKARYSRPWKRSCAAEHGRALQDIDPDKERPEWCPIKPMPQNGEEMMEENNAEWKDYDNGRFMCTECSFVASEPYRYCPLCGAKMRW